MGFIRHLYVKLYYHFWNNLLPGKKLQLPDSYKSKRNIFIYFDYEREFSGHETKITDENIYSILKLLKDNSIITTWFTVGKIFEKYPDSIKAIISQGHEIGSHTYAHIPPLHASVQILKNDFEKYDEVSRNLYKIRGIHSPNGKWSMKMLRYLARYNYCYDVITGSKNGKCKSHLIWIGNRKKIIRLQTMGDDWTLYGKNNSISDVFDFFVKQMDCIKPGEVGGIGFHPWILYSDRNILEGFIQFLNYAGSKQENHMNTAVFFAKALK